MLQQLAHLYLLLCEGLHQVAHDAGQLLPVDVAVTVLEKAVKITIIVCGGGVGGREFLKGVAVPLRNCAFLFLFFCKK